MTKSSYQKAKEKNAFNKKMILKLIERYEEDIEKTQIKQENTTSISMKSYYDGQITILETVIRNLNFQIENWEE